MHAESRSEDRVQCPSMLQRRWSSTVLEDLCVCLLDSASDTGHNVGISDKKSKDQELERLYFCCSKCLHFEHRDRGVHPCHICPAILPQCLQCNLCSWNIHLDNDISYPHFCS